MIPHIVSQNILLKLGTMVLSHETLLNVCCEVKETVLGLPRLSGSIRAEDDDTKVQHRTAALVLLKIDAFIAFLVNVRQKYPSPMNVHKVRNSRV